ncbi:hypothetical protein GCM10009602_00080 [Nocardiopsis tropica]
MLVKRPTPNWSRTPASSPAASGTGTRSITLSNQPVTPLRVIRAAENRNAPTACAIVTPSRPTASSAAPGVDHAVTTGAR